MGRITNRNFLADFLRLGIEYGPDDRGPDVSQDVQMVYIMGNVAAAATVFGTGLQQLPAPADSPVSAVSQFIGGVAGQVATCELVVAATIAGVWASPIASGAETEFNVYTLGARSGLATTIVPTLANATIFGAGTLPASEVDLGTKVSANPATGWNTRMSQEAGVILYPPMIWVATGRVLVIEGATANQAKIVGMLWREVAA